MISEPWANMLVQDSLLKYQAPPSISSEKKLKVTARQMTDVEKTDKYCQSSLYSWWAKYSANHGIAALQVNSEWAESSEILRHYVRL